MKFVKGQALCTLNILRNAVRNKKKVVFIALEMSREMVLASIEKVTTRLKQQESILKKEGVIQ